MRARVKCRLSRRTFGIRRLRRNSRNSGYHEEDIYNLHCSSNIAGYIKQQTYESCMTRSLQQPVQANHVSVAGSIAVEQLESLPHGGRRLHAISSTHSHIEGKCIAYVGMQTVREISLAAYMVVFSGEGGEGVEEGGTPDSPGSKLAGDDASSEPVSPTSATAADSPGGLQEDVDGAGSVTPVPTASASPATPSPMVVDGHETEPEAAITMLQDPLALR
jgi:hypothetical protein